MTHWNARENRAVEPEGLGVWGFARKTPAQPTQQDTGVEERLEKMFGDLLQHEIKMEALFQVVQDFSVRVENRLKSIESRLPSGLPAVQTAIRAKNHDTPLYTRPP